VKKSSTIDRATLLRGTGTAALATLLAGALEGRADACCSPIDLMYTDDPIAMATPARRMTSPIQGLWLWSSHDHIPNPPTPPGPPWQRLYSVANAHASGTDERGNGHGDKKHPTPLNYTIEVWVLPATRRARNRKS